MKSFISFILCITTVSLKSEGSVILHPSPVAPSVACTLVLSSTCLLPPHIGEPLLLLTQAPHGGPEAKGPLKGKDWGVRNSMLPSSFWKKMWGQSQEAQDNYFPTTLVLKPKDRGVPTDAGQIAVSLPSWPHMLSWLLPGGNPI